MLLSFISFIFDAFISSIKLSSKCPKPETTALQVQVYSMEDKGREEKEDKGKEEKEEEGKDNKGKEDEEDREGKEIVSPMTENAIDFGIWWGLIHKIDRSYLVMGGKGAGKSVAIDLLTDKVMTHQEADGTDGSVVVEDENYECIYPHIYFQQFKDLLFLEGFTLGDKLQPLDLAKVVFFKETVLAAKYLSLVIVLEEKEIQSLPGIIEHLLDCLQLSNRDNPECLRSFASHIYLLLTKAEEEEVIGKNNQRCLDLIAQTGNEAVKQILERLAKDNRIKDFPNKAPKEGHGKELRQYMEPSRLDKDLKQFIEKEAKGGLSLSEQQVDEVFSLTAQLINLISSLLRCILGQKGQEGQEGQGDYEKLVSELYLKHRPTDSLKTKKMANSNWKVDEGRNMTAFEGIANERNEKTAFKGILAALTLILDSLKETAPDKRGYVELRGMVQFITGMLPSMREQLCSKKVDPLIPLMKQFFKALLFKKEEPEGKITAIEKVKKVPNIADLKAMMEGVKNNGSAIAACLQTIKDREDQADYSWCDFIFEVKMVRQLLAQFDFSPERGRYLFVEELLQLYLYNDCYFEFDRLIDLYLRHDSLLISTAKSLLRPLYCLGHYDCQLKLINYVIASTVSQEDFATMNSIKHKVIFRSNQQHLKGDRHSNSSKNNVTQRLGLSMASISTKLNHFKLSEDQNEAWTRFCASASYNLILKSTDEEKKEKERERQRKRERGRERERERERGREREMEREMERESD